MHMNPDVDFNMLDLLMSNGRVSKISCLVMGAFGVTSWLMLELTVHNKMTEGYFGLYCTAWVAPLITQLMNAGPSTTTTISASSVTTTKGKK